MGCPLSRAMSKRDNSMHTMLLSVAIEVYITVRYLLPSFVCHCQVCVTVRCILLSHVCYNQVYEGGWVGGCMGYWVCVAVKCLLQSCSCYCYACVTMS